MSDTTIPAAINDQITAALARANDTVGGQFPGDASTRQPVHTVYGGAHLFSADIERKLGTAALTALQEYAPAPSVFADAVAMAPDLASRIYPRIVEKLTREPVEDFRIDFEDGFGTRSDDEEDRVARSAADEVAKGLATGTLPAGIGIRIKALSEEQ